MAKKGYPLFESVEVDEKTHQIILDGVTHQVVSKYTGGGCYEFHIDNKIHQTCSGHPVNDDQAPGVPPAAVIAIITGGKSVNLPWSTFWERFLNRTN